VIGYKPKTLEELDIEPTQSHRWQTIAGMPEDYFGGYD